MKLEESQNIVWGISGKGDGRMKMLETSDEEARENRGRFFGQLGLAPENIVSAGLVHSNRVAAIKDALVPVIAETDALVTDRKGLVLSLTVADCAPLYFYDPKRQAVGLAHAGWKGVVGNIGGETVARLRSEFGSQSADIMVLVGPHIRKCHFEVQEDVASQFADFGDSMESRDDKTYIDLSAVILKQLAAAGVREENISLSPECTFCEDNKYFSYRRDKPARLEAMAAYIGLK
ncbi:peptidoglycan editing factor PgeF [Candidatus Falkowbacteria bacterium]|nr:peptidoglycan editing factor PgeF [Candidatus Falkowbacteria bacterium]